MKNLVAFLTTVVTLVSAVPNLNQNEMAKNKLFDVFEGGHSMSMPDKKLMEPKSWGKMRGLSDSTNIVTLTNRKNCSSCVCGRANLANEQTRIIGGHDVKHVNQYPWMVQLRHNSGEFLCGGSLLNSKYVLTAAHCVHNISENDLSIRLLAYDRNDIAGNKLINSQVKQILRHDSYCNRTGEPDIALIHLDEEVELGNTLNKPSPICLPTGNTNYTGMDGVVIGWGSTGNKSSSPSILQEVRVPIISNEDCKTGYNYAKEQITSNMICAVHPNGGKSPCNGDSGGPLMVITESTTQAYSLVGVVSWGVPECDHPHYPSVYSRVDRYLKWIKDSIKDACSC